MLWSVTFLRGFKLHFTSPIIFQKSRNRFRILGCRRMAWNKVRTKDSHVLVAHRTKFSRPGDGSRVVLCGRTDMTKLIVAFRSFAKAPNYGLNLRIESTAAVSSCHASEVPTPKRDIQIALSKTLWFLSRGLVSLTNSACQLNVNRRTDIACLWSHCEHCKILRDVSFSQTYEWCQASAAKYLRTALFCVMA